MQHDFILLDRSSSMTRQWSEALSSVNAYVAKLAADNVDTGVTLATFDEQARHLCFEVIRDRITPRTWRPVSVADAAPRGGTPLSDAVGRIVGLANAGNYSRVAIIIMTDGQENASNVLSVDQAKAMLDDCRKKEWQVVFLGANFDNAAQAAAYGNPMRSTVQVDTTNLVASATMTAAKRGFYGLTGQNMNYSDSEKADLLKPKNTL